MRVLVVAHGHPELSPGGGEIAAYNLFRGLAAREGVQATFLAWSGDPAARARAPRIGSFDGRPDEFLFDCDGFDRFRFEQASPALADSFAALLRTQRPDVVHFHHYLNIGFDLFRAVRRVRPDARIVLTLHEFLAICHNYGTMVRRSARLELCDEASPADCATCFPERSADDFAARHASNRSALEAVDVLLSPSRFLAERYVAWGVPEAKILVVENGLDHDGKRAPPRRTREGERNVFGFFGQIHPYKGLLELLSAIIEAGKRTGDWRSGPRLLIHGAYLELNDPAYIRAFESRLAACGARARFLGAYDRRDLAGLMGAVDWVVAPSIWWENAPLVIEEALSHGRPVICSDIGGMAEKVRPGRDGYHFRVGDISDLAALMLRLSSDPEAWRRLRRTMRRPIAVGDIVARHLTIYHAALAARQGAGGARLNPA